MSIQTPAHPYEVVYRPRFQPLSKTWFAWVARDHTDRHKPEWARRLAWWPIPQSVAEQWFQSRLR